MKLVQHITLPLLLIVKKLPTIALYAVVFYALLYVGEHLWYANKTADYFVHYTSFTVQNSREGEDVPFTLCRDHRGNFLVNGIRTISIIPQGGTVKDRVFAHSDPLNGSIDSGNCATYFIRDSQYHHKPGQYVLTINLHFKVKDGYEKQEFITSQPYKIYAQPAGSDATIDTTINNLNARIQENTNELNALKRRLGLPTDPGSDPNAQPQSFTSPSQTPRSTPSNAPAASGSSSGGSTGSGSQNGSGGSGTGTDNLLNQLTAPVDRVLHAVGLGG